MANEHSDLDLARMGTDTADLAVLLEKYTLKDIKNNIEDMESQHIVYQIKLLSKRKNELIVEEINSQFNIVKWKLFDYQANGEYIDCCIPLIDGRDFTYSANGTRKILAKLEICSVFQRLYEMNFETEII